MPEISSPHCSALPSFFRCLSIASASSPSPSPSPSVPNKRTQTPILETLSSHKKEQISLYVGALLQWNQRMNLTAVTQEDEVLSRHVEDSLAIIPIMLRSYLSNCSSTSSCDGIDVIDVIDVGSGAGLPGLILAIAYPSWKITLLESMHKRCLFLEHAVSHIGLSNVQILHERAENVGQNVAFRERFDVAVARAVAELRVLAEYCIPFVRVGGLFIAAKGYDPQEEVKNAEKAIHLMGASISELSYVKSYSPHGQRTVVTCLKKRSTPRRYPRQPGTPSKIPL
ncbi:ribosomal RNA small subunit methyltransferase G [Dioscorea cayenensis subsp. rotundata]|uniref:Ribosomal RNA small subunit methyltransferase G n=1 Tax=Dioscorea cayennensis subsp. rotundata TaxID=55577 RepID=A0AB40D4R8_DIOCR|nr:ribosomal RNA small subunit methyltransferase G [Dioscorea cayenensis subsp. rotundata]